MNRPIIIIPLIMLLSGAASWWAWTHFQWEKTREWVGYSGAACSDRLYAARLLAARLGARTRSLDHFDDLAFLPTRATLIVTTNAGEFSRTQIASVLAWTRKGGHLLIEMQGLADAEQADPARLACDRGGPQQHKLLQEFNIDSSSTDKNASLARHDATSTDEDTEEGADKQESGTPVNLRPTFPQKILPPQRGVATFPERSGIRVDFGAVATLRERQPRASWRMDGRGGALALRFAEGKGIVTVVASLRPADNWHIDQNDHAEFFWLLATAPEYPPAHQEEFIFVRSIAAANLWQWLQRYARPALIMIGIFVVLILWRVMPRFGPIAPDQPRGMRSLYQHLAASGRFLYRNQRQARLMSALREECLQQLLRAAPEARQMENDARLRVAAEMSGMPLKLLSEAFSATPRNAREFLLTARTLAQVRMSLLANNRKLSGSTMYQGQ